MNQQVNVVVGTRHQMSTTEVHPLQLWEPTCKFLFYMLQGALENVCPTLAVAMTMKALNTFRQHIGQFVGTDAKTCSWRTGIVEHGFHLRILRIDTQTETDVRLNRLNPVGIAFILAEGIEGEMTGTACYRIYLVIGICRRIGMRARTKLLKGKTGLAE